MAGNVQTDLQSVIDFRARLMRFNRLLSEEYHAVVVGWRGLGGTWRDAKYDQFGEALDEVGRGIDRYLAVTDEHEAHLLRLIDSIQQYLDVR